jgi:hypothetical protein
MLFINELLICLGWKHPMGDTLGAYYVFDDSVGGPVCAWIGPRVCFFDRSPRWIAVDIPRILGDVDASPSSSLIYRGGGKGDSQSPFPRRGPQTIVDKVEFIDIHIGHANTTLGKAQSSLVDGISITKPNVERARVSRGSLDPATDPAARAHDLTLFKPMMAVLPMLSQTILIGTIKYIANVHYSDTKGKSAALEHTRTKPRQTNRPPISKRWPQSHITCTSISSRRTLQSRDRDEQ